jgi:acyl-CoA thioesterase-1
MRVLIFGDSIIQGFYDEQGGWAARLINYYLAQEIAHKDNVPTLFNLGISGDTTTDVLARFDFESAKRIVKGADNALVFAIGTNDTIYRKDEVDSTPEKYTEQLTELLQIAKTFTNKILFVSLFPVIDSLLQPFPWSTSGKCYSTERMQLFNTALNTFCDNNNLLLVDVWNSFNTHPDLDSLFFDGIHPNATGHELIARTVQPKLAELIT